MTGHELIRGLIFSLEHLIISLEANPNWDTALHVTS